MHKLRGLTGMIGMWMLGVFLLVAFSAWHLLADIDTVHKQIVEVNSANQKSHDLHELELGLVHLAFEAQSFLVDGNPDHQQHFEMATQILSDHLDTRSLDAEQLRDFQTALHNTSNLAKQIFSLPFATGNMEGPILIQEIKDQLASLTQSIGKYHHQLDVQVDQAMQMATGLHIDMRNDSIGRIIALLAILVGLTIYLYRRLVKPLNRLKHEVEKVSMGEFDLHCPELGSNELGDLARALNMMGAALQERDEALAKARSMDAHHEKMHVLGLMSAGIAHELGNPLAAAMISMEMSKRKLDRSELNEAGKFVEDALNETRRIENIIHNVLDFGRAGISEEAGLFELVPVLESARRLAGMSPQRKKVDIRIVDMPKELPALCGISSMLLQVIVNLILNAVDACNEQGQVIIRAGIDEKMVWIDIEDNGSGIPEEIQDNIFSPLFTTKTSGQGTGMGLSISRDLMQRMHGDLYLMESGPHGSRFRVILPASGSDACLC